MPISTPRGEAICIIGAIRLAARMPMKLFTAPLAPPLLLLAAATTLAAGACGYPTFTFEPQGTGTGGTVSTGTGGGTTGTGGDPATSSVTASSSGTGGAPACTLSHTGKKGTCEYLPGKECGCMMPGEKCAVEVLSTGESNCIPISLAAKPKWSGCQTDADCAKGTWCDHRNRVCEPICITLDDCDPGQQCIEVLKDGTTTPVPGLRVCTSHCDPINPDPPCGAGLTCIYNFGVKDSECAKTGGVPEGSSCDASNSCDPGLICVGIDPSYTCELWCSPADSLDHPVCPNGRPYCKPFNPTVVFEGVSYGVCSP
jgi:hypothetical protein